MKDDSVPLSKVNTWQELVPLPVTDIETGKYPINSLPLSLRAAAEEVARFTKVPPAPPAVIGMSAAATAIGTKAKIEERPGLVHNLALFHIVIAPVANGSHRYSR